MAAEPRADPLAPVEPAPSPWEFPDPRGSETELIAIGADLAPGSLLTAYRSGLFPMPISAEDVGLHAVEGAVGWWSPDPRGVIELEEFRVTKSLRRSRRRFEVTFDRDFTAVMRACGSPDRDGGWINDAFVDAYAELHRLGWARSVEVWDHGGGAEPELVGGLYGVSIGSFFAGESMFSLRTDASKVALVHLVEELDGRGCQLLDVQWCTEHLRTLGASELPRDHYLERLAAAVAAPHPSL